MSDYDNTNTGALFKNEDKESEKHPDYKGNLNVNGEEFWLAAWLKVSKNGKKYMSLKISPKERQKITDTPAFAKKDETIDTDIPF